MRAFFTAFLATLLAAALTAGPTQQLYLTHRASGGGGGGGGWVPSDEASLKRWINSEALGGSLSDGDPISSAADASGNGNSLSASGSERPTYNTGIKNGRPAMTFSAGATTRLAGSAVSGTAKTWGIAYRATSDIAALMGTLSSVANYYNFGGAGYFCEFRAARIETYPSSVPTTGDNVIIGISDGSSYEVWVNNTSAGSQSANFSAGDTFLLGRNGNGTSYANSYIYEYVEFNATFDSTQRGNLYTYLSGRWQ